MTDAKSIAAAVKHVADITSGRLQCLINNARFLACSPLVTAMPQLRHTDEQAGAVGRGLTLDADLNKYKYIFDVNFFGCLAMAQAFAPLLIRTSQQDKGKDGFVKPCIMNVSLSVSRDLYHVDKVDQLRLHRWDRSARLDLLMFPLIPVAKLLFGLSRLL